MNWILSIWLTLLSVGLSHFLSFHMTALKLSELPDSVRLAKEFQTQHFISTRCACSKRVAEHLKERGPIAAANETIYLLDGKEEDARDLIKAGFKVENVDETTAQTKFHVEAVPFLRISSQGHVLYAGAYGKDQKHSSVYEDVEIVQNALKGVGSHARPMFGCINGKIRKESFDIWGLKYGSK